jgi:hypothetical protein
MAEPCLIANYEAILRAELPVHLAEEVSDGLAEAYAKYIRVGQWPDAAAQSAVAEFGSARAVVTAFARASQANRTARALVITGPAVGMCWAATLITSQAWDWPVPNVARLILGGLLALSVLVLVTAVRARRYWTVRHSATAGSVGLVVLDASMIPAAAAYSPSLHWLAGIAILASTSRLFCTVRMLAHQVASCLKAP